MQKGNGLGLAVTKGLIELINGEISIKSSKKEGAIFTIDIPEAKNIIPSSTSNGNEFLFDTLEKF